MGNSLEALKKKKQELLKKGGMKSANLESLKARHAEEKKLKAEIYALEHPESARAKQKLKSAAGIFGRFVKERASIVAENAVRMERQRRERALQERREERQLEIARLKASGRRKSPAKRKVVRKKKTTRKRR